METGIPVIARALISYVTLCASPIIFFTLVLLNNDDGVRLRFSFQH